MKLGRWLVYEEKIAEATIDADFVGGLSAFFPESRTIFKQKMNYSTDFNKKMDFLKK